MATPDKVSCGIIPTIAPADTVVVASATSGEGARLRKTSSNRRLFRIHRISACTEEFEASLTRDRVSAAAITGRIAERWRKGFENTEILRPTTNRFAEQGERVIIEEAEKCPRQPSGLLPLSSARGVSW